ncbi:MAG: aminomethyl-transferring glycine dehydrogenase subunit GcvPB, partial [Duncaniella sp.]|nr:aminomethyl-transferring glycine dehydrogenase subunit GcvPB [Duncaniella sp.]
LLFHESLMIEPTETESRETLDEFIAGMRDIAREAAEDPATVKNAPHDTPVRRPDDTTAALKPVVTYQQMIADDEK